MFPKRDRPPRLSNRNCCFSDDRIAAIDEKDVGLFTWSDFEAIFTLSGCTAEYDQQLYYLPLALTHLKEHPGEASDFVAGLVNFIASHQERLGSDGVLGSSIHWLRDCFDLWTRKFDVVHFDAAACAAKGWRRDHNDYVENSDGVRELVHALVTYGLAALAEELVESWTALRSAPEASAWLLEFANEERERYDYSGRDDWPPELGKAPGQRSPRIASLVMNDLLLQANYDAIKDTLVAAEESPTYWPDLVESLSLDA